MRVLHLLKTSVGGKWALRQMRELVKLNVEVHVALPSNGPLVGECEAAGIVVHRAQFDFPIGRSWRFPRTARDLKALVASVDPDIIHSHFVGTTLSMRLALGAAHRIPRVFQVPGPLHLEHALYRRAELLTAGRNDYWIGSCRWTCDRYRRSGIPANRCFLSYYGLDLEQFCTPGDGSLRRELGVDRRTKIVGMVAFMYAPKRFLGQTRGLKGHEDLIDAVALCLDREPNLLCVFIGGAWNNAVGYERAVRTYGRQKLGARAVFLGTRRDVPRLYPDIDVAVHPSHSENVGGAPESLLTGVPTIATNVGGFPDLIIDGDTGWLVPPRSPARLADTMLRVLADPAGSRDMAARGRQRARQLFDVRATARQIAGIYDAILDQPAA